MKNIVQETCDVCYRIICRQCGWEAVGEEVQRIQENTLTNCPICGWKPSDNIRKL